MNIGVILLLSLFFFLSEFVLMLSKRSKSAKVKSQKDRKSLLLFWLTIPFSLTLGFFLARYQAWDTINIVLAVLGIILFTAGLLIRWLAIMQLQKAFTVDVAIAKDHRLKTGGIYKRIRHPSYTGLLLICLGLGIGMNSLLSFVVVLLPVFAAVLYRIKVEEAMLSTEFGEAYKNYQQKTVRLFPKIY